MIMSDKQKEINTFFRSITFMWPMQRLKITHLKNLKSAVTEKYLFLNKDSQTKKY